jgi:hypothetical protein
MVERTKFVGLAAADRQRSGRWTQQHSLDDVGRRLVRGGAQGRRHDFDTGAREVAPQPAGGGVAPLIPVVNADAGRRIRTMHETRVDMRAERSAARHEPASDDMHPIVPALITDTLPAPVIISPQIACGPSPGGLSFFRIAVRKVFVSIVRSRRANPHGNSTLIPIPVHQQANKRRSHLPMSVKQNLVTDRAREFRARF